jgi:hypothetical protein
MYRLLLFCDLSKIIKTKTICLRPFPLFYLFFFLQADLLVVALVDVVALADVVDVVVPLAALEVGAADVVAEAADVVDLERPQSNNPQLCPILTTVCSSPRGGKITFVHLTWSLVSLFMAKSGWPSKRSSVIKR